MTKEPYYARLREIDVGPGKVELWMEDSPYGLPPQHLATLILVHSAGVLMMALHPNWGVGQIWDEV